MQAEGLPQLECVCAGLRRAARSVTRLYERALGVSVPQFTILYVLDKQPGQIQGVLAELLAIDRTTLTRTLGSMERSGVIFSRPGEDKRERSWWLRPAGRKELAHILPRWQKVQELLRKRLGVDRYDLLINELTIVAAAARMRPSDGVHRFRVGKRPATRL